MPTGLTIGALALHPRHAGECRYLRLALPREDKSWMPAFAGMTIWAMPQHATFAAPP